VQDDGIGISSELLPELFKLFVQGDVVSTRAKGGLGIGLALVRDLVKLHGGDAFAKSAGVGCGSEFSIHLPLATEVADVGDDSLRPVPPLSLERMRERVLIVDDNESACRAVKMALELLGANTLVTHDGPSALQRLEEFQPTLVLLDLGLPGMDGHELARQIRKAAMIAPPRLVAVTGWGHEQVRTASKDAGIDEHLVKPIGIKDIERLLQRP
jgi:CheY-like chemotaxis protein